MKPAKSKKKCPHCKKAVVWKNNPYRPFCSKRCRMIDLGHWVLENYRIAGEKVAKEEKD